MRKRVIVPEILDNFPPDHPDSKASRRDLRRINQVMGNLQWFRHQLSHLPLTGKIVELGAGDGFMGVRLRGSLPRLAGHYCGTDLLPKPPAWPSDFSWHQGDFFKETADSVLWSQLFAITGNFILHHFDDKQIRALATCLRKADTIFFNEPARYHIHMLPGFLSFPFINRITRFDMMTSIRAGFRKGEIARLLELDASQWIWREQRSFLGSLRFMAWKIRA